MPTAADRCSEHPFDPSAALGPEFDHDIFVRDESAGIANTFLEELTQIYARGGEANPCDSFTGDGWASAIAWDPRLEAADRGNLVVEQTASLRVAFELGGYDLRIRPPRDPLDLIFDISPGARTTNRATGEVVVSEAVERVGIRVDFVYDGHRWRAERVGEVDPSQRDYLVLPTVPPDRPACVDFVRDSGDAPFDVDADRTWCEEDGQGKQVMRPDQLVLFTRYPCDVGRAAILTIGRPLGVALDPLRRWEYVRDPSDEFLDQAWITEPFDDVGRLPDDAAYTGWTNGNVDLWISASELDRAIYLVRGDTVERWPRAAEYWGVIDCN